MAGTPGDARQIERLVRAFEAMGLETEVHEFHPLLAKPVHASLEIVARPGDTADEIAPDGDTRPGAEANREVALARHPDRRGVIPLGLRERNLLNDPATAHPDLSWGWNAYSASGAIEAEIVYANLARREDFESLRAAGVDVRGKIVLARYGGLFRGSKARFAEEAGAAGLLLFLDPGDVGDRRGPTYPEGGWANDTCIQRGSVLSLGYPGDPLTPGFEATIDAPRLEPADVALPRILVQPIGYAAAAELFLNMRGAVAPEAWQGGLPLPYRLEGGPALRVRLVVEQDLEITRTANVLATLRGASHPEEFVVVGCHHDAWGFGAADPLAGTIVLMECARTFAEAAARGDRPARTILFAAWGAEEFGIIGSTEWVEANRRQLESSCIAYVNLDMAAMGCDLGVSATPSLFTCIAEAIGDVPVARAPERSVGERWATSGGASFSVAGGGSDHVGFACHAGVAVCSVAAGGSPGTSYHSNYDTLAWYRLVVGEDYEPALMVTRATNALLRALAGEETIPLDIAALGDAIARAATDLARNIASTDDDSNTSPSLFDAAPIAEAAARLRASWERLRAAVAAGTVTIDRFNSAVVAADRRLICDEGLPDRPWFRNVFVAVSNDNGYAADQLPELRAALASGDPARTGAACADLEARLRLMTADLESALTAEPPSTGSQAASDDRGSAPVATP